MLRFRVKKTLQNLTKKKLTASSLGIKKDILLHSSLLIKALTLEHIWKAARTSCCLSDILLVANRQFPHMWQFASVTTHTQMSWGTEVPVRRAGPALTYDYERNSRRKKGEKKKTQTLLNECFSERLFIEMFWEARSEISCSQRHCT